MQRRGSGEIDTDEIINNKWDRPRYGPRVKGDPGVRTCIFCGKQGVYALGYCKTCYGRYQRNGTPEYIKRGNRAKEKREARRREREREKASKLENWKEEIAKASIPGVEISDDLDEILDSLISKLAPKEREIVLAKFKEGKTYKEIGKERGFTYARAEQITTKALRKLKHGYDAIKAVEDAKARNCDPETSIRELGLSIKIMNCLLDAGYETAEDLLQFLENGGTLCSIKGIGLHSETDITNLLRSKFNNRVDLIFHRRDERLTRYKCRGMDGQPVWVESNDPERCKWMLVRVRDDGKVFLTDKAGKQTPVTSRLIKAIYGRKDAVNEKG